MRRSPIDEGRRWLDQAQEDLRWALHLRSQGAHYLVCFLSQQVAEKALKAFLYAQGEETVLGHSVRQLCLRAAEYDSGFRDHIDDWAILDTYYVAARNPDVLPDGIPSQAYNEEAATSASTKAEAIVAYVGRRLDHTTQR